MYYLVALKCPCYKFFRSLGQAKDSYVTEDLEEHVSLCLRFILEGPSDIPSALKPP